jgi:hypothetical protein
MSGYLKVEKVRALGTAIGSVGYETASNQVGSGNTMVMLLNDGRRTVAVMVDSKELFENWYALYIQGYFKGGCCVMALPQSKIQKCLGSGPVNEAKIEVV